MIQTGDVAIDAVVAQLTAELIRAIEEKAGIVGQFEKFKSETAAKFTEINKELVPD